ncbi:hypothetical protein [Kaarinaea lacus]
MRLGYLSARMVIAANIVGILLCIGTSTWIFLSHTNLTPVKTERVFQKNIQEANKIKSIDAFRQVHQSILLGHKREQLAHYETVSPIIWLGLIAIAIFLLNAYIFWQLVREKSIRIR